MNRIVIWKIFPSLTKRLNGHGSRTVLNQRIHGKCRSNKKWQDALYMKYLFVATMFLTIIGMTQGVYADSLIIKPGDSIPKILEVRKVKQVTLRLSDSDEMSGKVRSV